MTCYPLVTLVLSRKTRCKCLQHKRLRADSRIPKLDVVGSNPIARFHIFFLIKDLQNPWGLGGLVRCRFGVILPLLAAAHEAEKWKSACKWDPHRQVKWTPLYG